MQNIEILNKQERSMLLDAVKASNQMKVEREAQARREAAIA
jgi:hypothetical protein